MAMLVLLRGGGDLASGVALRLYRAGLRLLITELPQPLTVRRLVSFAEAVYRGQITIEGISARLAEDLEHALLISEQGDLPVLVDPENQVLVNLRRQPIAPIVLVDARMTKRPPNAVQAVDLFIGLGPGFVAGHNCHAVIETNRGHQLGRVIWEGTPQADTGIPEGLPSGKGVLLAPAGRVLRAPVDGLLRAHAEIGDHLEAGQLVAEVSSEPVYAPFKGVLRGLLHPGLLVERGMKIGDVDPRDDPRYCVTVSDKSLAIGGGVLEAILARPGLRRHLWDFNEAV